jgi:hypothetical protein
MGRSCHELTQGPADLAAHLAVGACLHNVVSIVTILVALHQNVTTSPGDGPTVTGAIISVAGVAVITDLSWTSLDHVVSTSTEACATISGAIITITGVAVITGLVPFGGPAATITPNNRAITGAIVIIHHIAVIAGFYRKSPHSNHEGFKIQEFNPVTTSSKLTESTGTVGADVIIFPISIVAPFHALVDDTITADREQTVVQAGIPILVVAIVTLFHR